MIWRLLITAGAERDLNNIPEPDSKRIKDELRALADEPQPKSYVKKVKGHSRSPLYSFRVGQYRAILTIEGTTMIITLVEVGNWSNVYRNY
jgi:mRNA interferase RelE/StbE